MNLLFPSLCLHCKEESSSLFCKGCAPDFELIDLMTRCPFCCIENGERYPCMKCREKKRERVLTVAALDYFSAVQSFLYLLKTGRMPYLTKTAASFLLMQFHKTGWEIPDLIIPIPKRFWFQTESHVESLARLFGKFLDVKVENCLRKRLTSGVEEEEFYLRRRAVVEDKTILLIEDLVSPAIQKSALTLKGGFAKKVTALALASADLQVIGE